MPINIGGVDCEVISKGYEEHADQSGQGATRGYLCDWNDRFKVAHALLGLVRVSGTGAGTSIDFENPMGLAELPLMVAMGVRIEGKGRPINNAVGLGYERAIVWATYGILPYASGGGGQALISPQDSFIYCTQELDASETYVDIPGQVLEYVSDGSRSNINRAVQVTVVHMSLTFHKLPYIPMPALAHAGKVNDALFLGIARGKVKFDGVKVSRDYSAADSEVLQKATFRFSYRPISDWNAVPDPLVPGNWTGLKYRGTAIYPYPYYDLRSVWPGEYYESL